MTPRKPNRAFLGAFFWLTLMPLLLAEHTPETHFIQIINGFILLEGKIDGQAEGTFILDSGAPGIILNQRIYQSPTSLVKEVHSLSGVVETGQLQLKSAQIAGIEAQNLTALAIDLEFIEHAVGREIEGLVGLSFFKEKHLQIDFVASQLKVAEHPFANDLQRYIRQDIHWIDHIPTITAKIGDETLRLGLDTGSKVNLLCDRKYAEVETANDQVLNSVALVTAENQTSLQPKVQLEGFQLGMHRASAFSAVITDMSETALALSAPLDGILGYPFYQSHVLVLDLENDLLYLGLSTLDDFGIVPQRSPMLATISSTLED